MNKSLDQYKDEREFLSMSARLTAQGVEHQPVSISQAEYRSATHRDFDRESVKEVLSKLIAFIGEDRTEVTFKVLGFRDFAISTSWPLDESKLDFIFFCFDDDVQVFASGMPLLTFLGDRDETSFEEARVYLHEAP